VSNHTNSVSIDEDRPLPWAVFRDHPQCKDIAYIRSAGSSRLFSQEVCTLYNDACRHAQLLAAAPDLLAALRRVIEGTEDTPAAADSALAQARAAIAKAEGNS